jgi:hypothetical protein
MAISSLPDRNRRRASWVFHGARFLSVSSRKRTPLLLIVSEKNVYFQVVSDFGNGFLLANAIFCMVSFLRKRRDPKSARSNRHNSPADYTLPVGIPEISKFQNAHTFPLSTMD